LQRLKQQEEEEKEEKKEEAAQTSRKQLESTFTEEENGSLKTEKKLHKLLSKLLLKVTKLLKVLLTMPRPWLKMLIKVFKISVKVLLVRPRHQSKNFVKKQEFALTTQ
jgi:hypothetical protein